MAPAAVVSSPGMPALGSPYAPAERRSYSRQASSAMHDSMISIKTGGSRRESGRFFRGSTSVEPSVISNVVTDLKRRSDSELDSSTSAKLLDETYDSIRDWIGAQRLSHLPPEGSSYDKVLTWTQLFVERLNSFDIAIEEFARDSYLASQLAYGYCAILLDLGKENAPALMISFGFFYSISMSLVNLLERTELFSVSADIREQLVLALSDLVTLVASVATHFHKAIQESATSKASVSVNLYSTFSGQIKAFHERCDKIAQSMWQHQLVSDKQNADKISDVRTIKSWVAPEDRVLTNVAFGLSLLAHDREELTCLWVGPYLTRFLKSNDKVMNISGKPGSGKSIVASVVVDYLQRPISGIHYNALFVPISSRIIAETSERAVAKTILRQLFDKRTGNIQLLHILTDAHARALKAKTNEEYDNILWAAVERSFASPLPGAKELVLVVDGLDEASGGEKALLQRLITATSNGHNVRLITLGTEKHLGSGRMNVQMNDDLIFDDIMAVIRSNFESDNEFSTMPELDQESIITRLSQASGGSFLWAKLATKRLRREVGLDNFRDAVNTVVKTTPTVTDFVSRTLQSSSVTEETRLMLMWLTIAERPLSQKELGALLSIHLDKNAPSNKDKNTISDKQIDVLPILRPVQTLVFLQDGLLSIRHGLIRTSLRDLSTKGQLVSSIKDPHADFVSRLLFYIKTMVTEQRTPSFSVLDGQETNQLLRKYPLLDFAIRHWPYHLTQTSVFVSGGDGAAAKTFDHYYPVSNTALLLQGSLWAHRPKPLLIEYQSIITNIYRQLFKSQSPLTLQSVIFLAILYRQVDMPSRAMPLLFEATTTSHTLLGVSHNVTMQLAEWYIETTETQITTTKTDVMEHREKIFLMLVECYKVQYGLKSSQVVTIYRRLVEHYRSTKDEKKVQQILESLRSVTATTKSVGDGGEDSINDDQDLQVELKGKSRTTVTTTGDDKLQLDIEVRDELIKGTESYDFTYAFKEAEKFVAEKKFEQAERAYVEIWQHVSQEYRAHHSDIWAERNLRTVLSYTKFLQSQQKESEASAILVSIWQDYSQSIVSATETSASLLVQVAHVMKSVGLLSLSLTVFNYCSEYYKATNKTQLSVFKEIQQSVSETWQQVVKHASSSTSVTSESTLQELVLQYCSSSTTMNETALEATTKLVTLYMSQHRWEDAIMFLKKVLRIAWPSFFASTAQDVDLPKNHVEMCVRLAERLADCYRSPRRRLREEDTRVRIYSALRMGRKVDDKLRDRNTNELLSFYRRNSQTESYINTKQEILDDYSEHYGPTNEIVIKMLRELADLTRPRHIFVEYYQRLIRAINKDSETSKPEALQPVIIVATELWNRGQLSDALPYYRVLFNTFISGSKQSFFEQQSFVREFFERYTSCLRSVRTTFTVIHKVATEFRTRCVTLYSASASITVFATLHLAKICQESETYEQQAIKLYEELLTMKSEEINVQEIKETLTRINEEQLSMTMASTSSNKMTEEQFDRTITILKTRIVDIRRTHGWAHEESLSMLKQSIMLESHQNKTEMVQSELKDTMIKVLQTETSSTRLMAAASTIASLYVSTNQVQHATELTEEIYRQVVMKDTSMVKRHNFDLSSNGRQSLVFLAQLEYSLRRSSSTLAEILATLTTQYFYFSEFRTVLKSSSSSFQQVSVTTARLYHYLVQSGMRTSAKVVFDQFSSWFVNTQAKRLQIDAKSSSTQIKVFLQCVIDHFGTYKSSDMVQSIGIIGNTQVNRLIRDRHYNDAADLALMCFKYVSADESYHKKPVMVKLMLTMGMALGRKQLFVKPDEAARKKLLEASRTVIKGVLAVVKKQGINLAQVNFKSLNQLIGLLGEQEDYETLAWLLTSLWENRDAQHSWPASARFNLARRYIVARFCIGEYTAAVRLAEHIVYNCRRVHSLHHPATLEMSILLAQLYSGIAQNYLKKRAGATDTRDMANRYYRKSAAIHENILRVFSDAAYASVEDGSLMDSGFRSRSGSITSLNDGSPGSPLMDSFASLTHNGHQNDEQTDGQRVRQHLHLLKLSLERLGDWPKDYSEYERLNADVFREFADDLKGVEGVERWKLKSFGDGKAEANDDILEPKAIKNWELLDIDSAMEAHEEY